MSGIARLRLYSVSWLLTPGFSALPIPPWNKLMSLFQYGTPTARWGAAGRVVRRPSTWRNHCRNKGFFHLPGL